MCKSQKQILTIRNILKKSDGVIAFPTDTVWGLGCLVDNEEAVKRIYSIKGRCETKPLILLGSKIDHLVPYIGAISPKTQEIINKYLPGAVTLILQKSEKTPLYLSNNTIGIRIPDCPVFLEILEKSVDTHVLATTSANISGKKPALSKSEVENSLGNKIDYILDDYGFTPKGTESTVISIDLNENVKILRQGAVIIESRRVGFSPPINKEL